MVFVIVAAVGCLWASHKGLLDPKPKQKDTTKSDPERPLNRQERIRLGFLVEHDPDHGDGAECFGLPDEADPALNACPHCRRQDCAYLHGADCPLTVHREEA
jgi:hypothetical protein